MSPEELIEASNDLLKKITYFDELSKYANQTPECIEKLLQLVDSQARQIEALKAGWIADRAEDIVWLPERDTDWDTAAKEMARRTLAAEHPDLFGLDIVRALLQEVRP